MTDESNFEIIDQKLKEQLQLVSKPEPASAALISRLEAISGRLPQQHLRHGFLASFLFWLQDQRSDFIPAMFLPQFGTLTAVMALGFFIGMQEPEATAIDEYDMSIYLTGEMDNSLIEDGEE